jgi:hypothetical protein
VCGQSYNNAVDEIDTNFEMGDADTSGGDDGSC